MANDPYRKTVKAYERFIDGMNKGLKLVGIRMFRPVKGMNILDVGCGTGTHLELYQRYQCNLVGLDLSPSMLGAARRRLNESTHLDLGDARHMPYAAGRFDLVILMLTLHEMPAHVRPSVLNEVKRLLKKDGRILMVEFHTGPYQPIQGWITRIIILISEIAAGRAHFRNYRNFMAEGGLESLFYQNDLQVEKQQILAGGTFDVSLVRKQSG